MASTAKFDLWQDTTGKTFYGARAWVNFNGTGTVAIRSSGNVSSITDLGVGNYRVNYATTLTATGTPTVGLSTVASVNNMTVNTNFGINVYDQQTSRVSVLCIENGSSTDKSEVSIVTFGQ